jgi:hypothetical protein
MSNPTRRDLSKLADAPDCGELQRRALRGLLGQRATVAPRRPVKAWKLAGYDSEAEQRYAAALEWRRKAGEVREWYRSPLTVVLRWAPRRRDRVTYRPDFLVVYPDGRLVLVEVKGWEREDDAIKFKLAADRLPEFAWEMVRCDRRGFRVARRIDGRAEPARPA